MDIRKKNGCATCCCEPEPKCNCTGEAPTTKKLCADGKNYEYYNGKCARTSDNKCYWVQVKCPICVSVNVEGNLTDVDETKIKKKCKVPESDYNSEKDQECGDKKRKCHKIYISDEVISNSSSKEDVADNIQTSLKSKNCVAYIISNDPAPESKEISIGYNIMVPFLITFILVLLG